MRITWVLANSSTSKMASILASRAPVMLGKMKSVKMAAPTRADEAENGALLFVHQAELYQQRPCLTGQGLWVHGFLKVGG
jgi:hypothetical protein